MSEKERPALGVSKFKDQVLFNPGDTLEMVATYRDMSAKKGARCVVKEYSRHPTLGMLIIVEWDRSTPSRNQSNGDYFQDYFKLVKAAKPIDLDTPLTPRRVPLID